MRRDFLNQADPIFPSVEIKSTWIQELYIWIVVRTILLQHFEETLSLSHYFIARPLTVGSYQSITVDVFKFLYHSCGTLIHSLPSCSSMHRLLSEIYMKAFDVILRK